MPRVWCVLGAAWQGHYLAHDVGHVVHVLLGDEQRDDGAGEVELASGAGIRGDGDDRDTCSGAGQGTTPSATVARMGGGEARESRKKGRAGGPGRCFESISAVEPVSVRAISSLAPQACVMTVAALQMPSRWAIGAGSHLNTAS